jgi:hypothetical protein
MKKMSTPDIIFRRSSPIGKKFKDILELTNAARNGPLSIPLSADVRYQKLPIFCEIYQKFDRHKESPPLTTPIHISWSSQMRKMPSTDTHEDLTNSDILELTNEENAYYGYSGGALQFRYPGA